MVRTPRHHQHCILRKPGKAITVAQLNPILSWPLQATLPSYGLHGVQRLMRHLPAFQHPVTHATIAPALIHTVIGTLALSQAVIPDARFQFQLFDISFQLISHFQLVNVARSFRIYSVGPECSDES